MKDLWQEMLNSALGRSADSASFESGKRPVKRLLPFFIPMEGCPNACIYCDQHRIAGKSESPQPQQIEAAALALETPHELAFYGGSFTMLPLERQELYLNAAAKARNLGKLSGIRLSTRPDAIDATELDLLQSYGVSCIELGVQSFEQEVLRSCGRYYNADTVRQAARLIKQRGIELGLQLMQGLPSADFDSDIKSGLQAASLMPDYVRLYPTLVLSGTDLAEHYQKGLYLPLPLPAAVELCRELTAIFLSRNIEILRIGLHNTPELGEGLLAGPFSPALGAEVYSSLALEHMRAVQALSGCKGITAEQSYLPRLFGHQGMNRAWIAKALPEGLHGSRELPRHTLSAEGIMLGEQTFLKQYVAKYL